MDLSTTITRWMLYVMGVMFILPPVIIVLRKLFFRMRCKVATGKLLRIEKNKDEDGNVMINPIYGFVNYRGEEIELKRGVGYGLKYIPEVGALVKIYYLPRDLSGDSQKADVASSGLWVVSGLLILAGGSLLFMANYLLI